MVRRMFIALVVSAVLVVGDAGSAPRRANGPAPVCDVDLLDAGDGAAIKGFAKQIEKAGFRVAHTGEAKDAHPSHELFFTAACEERAKVLAKVLSVGPYNLHLATWKVSYGLTFVPEGDGKRQRMATPCALPPDYSCAALEEEEDGQFCYEDPGGCRVGAMECNRTCSDTCARTCDPACVTTCDGCVARCPKGGKGDACRVACAKIRQQCRQTCTVCVQCATQEEKCRRRFCASGCAGYRACQEKSCKDPDSEACMQCDMDSPGCANCSG